MQFRMLFIEADEMIRRHFVGLMRRHGYECQPVVSLAAALEALREGAFSLVVLDLDLAGPDPSATASELRRSNPALRLIAFDSVAEHHGADVGPPAFDAVIPKPFVAEPFLAALTGLLAEPAAT